MLEELRRERRAINVSGLPARSGGSTPPTPACTATRSARRRPAGCRRRSSRTCPTRCRGWSGATRATHGPFTADDLRARYGVDCAAVLAALERAGELVRGELRPGGSEREWCDPEVLRRLRRASLAVLRKEVEPVDPRDARALPARVAGSRPPPGDRRRRRPAARGAGLAAGAGGAGRGVGARRAAAPRGRVLAGVDRSAVRERRARVDRGRRARALVRAGGAVLPRGPAGARPAAARGRGARFGVAAHEAVRARLAAGACFFTDLLVDVDLAPEELQEALWDLAWAGEATNDAFAPLRAPRLTLARAQRERGRGAPPGPGGSPRAGAAPAPRHRSRAAGR